MIYSTNYGDLLKRQAEIQRLGKMPTPTIEQVRVALSAEIGELAQELKPDWAWWSKPGQRKEIDRARVLEELADVVHFALLRDVTEREEQVGWQSIGPWSTHESMTLPELLDISLYSYGWPVVCSMCSIAARYGFTPDDLARAYWEKTEVNLQRWAACE